MAKWGLLKNLVLLLLLTLTVVFLFNAGISGTFFFILQLVLGFVYVSFAILQFSYAAEKASLPINRFQYIPHRVIYYKLIRIVILSIGGIVLFFSHSRFQAFSLLILFVIFADAIALFLRLRNQTYFVSLFANYVLISIDKELKLFASQITSVEYRYDTFYFTINERFSHEIELERIPESYREKFRQSMTEWLIRNKIKCTEECREALGIAFK